MSIIALLGLAGEALGAQQNALRTAGHNLSNVDTPGFSRQRVELMSAAPSVQGQFSIGRGVQVGGISSIVDQFLEDQLVRQHGATGFAEADSRAVSLISEAFPLGEEEGLNAAFDAFFGALNDVVNNPGGLAERILLISRAQALGETFDQMRSTLTNAQTGLDKDLDRTVRSLNAVLPQIAELNTQIVADEVGGGRANDLRDRRQNLLQEVARYSDAAIFEDSDGRVLVQVNGLVLVGGDSAATLSTTLDTATNLLQITHQGSGGGNTHATAMFDDGELGALLQARDTTLPDMLDRLDALAYNFVNTVNTQHALGFDLNGAAGGNFFTAIPAATAPAAAHAGAAARVQVFAALAADSDLIAAAQDAAGAPGDNRNALALVNLQTTTVAALGTQTFQDDFLSMVADIGSQVQASESAANFQKALLIETQARRESVSGVSIDEEMTNLIKFQRAFEAAARLVTVGDEMYQSVLAMVG